LLFKDLVPNILALLSASQVTYFQQREKAVRARVEDTMRSQTVAAALAIWLMFATGNMRAQSSRVSGQTSIVRMDFVPPNGDEMQQRMAKQANLERQARMKADTEKLFKLAEELKDSVGKSNENILSIEVLKKANEIEKLAHSVREKMRGPN
jgi:hypothetical protein